jgi:glycosyltransferase involved in cell wall biosynthesis
MRILIVRRETGVALSMDVYTDNLIAGLKTLRPDWTIAEIAPEAWSKNGQDLWKSGTGLRKYYERFWRHPRAVQHREADVVHIIDHTNAHVAYGLERSRRCVIVTCHDLVQFVYPKILRDQSRFPALSMAAWQYSVRGMAQADQVIAVSSNTAQDLTQYLNISPQTITVIPNGVDSAFQPLPSDANREFRQQQHCSPETICLLNVGSTHLRKNIPTILKVLVQLKTQGISVQLWKVGDDFTGEQQTFIQDHALEPLITQFGKPDRATLMQIYNAADVLLSPSLYEGFGLTVLEAMACGTPVIAARASSLPEVVGDAAILVEPMDDGAIVEAVIKLKNDRPYQESLVAKGLARSRQFSWQSTAEQVAFVYEKQVKKLNPIQVLS